MDYWFSRSLTPNTPFRSRLPALPVLLSCRAFALTILDSFTLLWIIQTEGNRSIVLLYDAVWIMTHCSYLFMITEVAYRSLSLSGQAGVRNPRLRGQSCGSICGDLFPLSSNYISYIEQTRVNLIHIMIYASGPTVLISLSRGSGLKGWIDLIKSDGNTFHKLRKVSFDPLHRSKRIVVI